MKKVVVFLLIICVIFFLIPINNVLDNEQVLDSDELLPNQDSDTLEAKQDSEIEDSTQDLKVLVIEINPILESITNPNIYPNNNGHPKVSEYFGQDTYKALEELKEDLEFASHGYLNIVIEHEYLNEFPRYKGYISRNKNERF